MSRFIPTAEIRLNPWLLNVVIELPAIATRLGMSAAEIKALTDEANLIMKKMGLVANLKVGLQKSIADKDTEKTDGLKMIADALNHLRSHPKFTDADEKALQMNVPTPAKRDYSLYKPVVWAYTDGGLVQLGIIKYGVHALNIYVKKPGDPEFTFLERITLSKYTDKRPLTTPGIAEIRQYMVMGVIADEEIGIQSDIITITFGG